MEFLISFSLRRLVELTYFDCRHIIRTLSNVLGRTYPFPSALKMQL
jgi:hypothetical protein